MDHRQYIVLTLWFVLSLPAGVLHGQTQPDEPEAQTPAAGDTKGDGVATPEATPHGGPALPTAEVTAPPDPIALTATVTGVENMVQVRASEDGDWKPVQVGMVVSQGAEFRTGPRSAVRLAIAPDQTISLDRLGAMTLIAAVRTGSKVKTDVGMKYGRTRYQIEKGGLEHQNRIISPNATLAVRGTETTVFDQPPYAPEAIVLTGRVEYKRAGRKPITFGGKGRRSSVSTDSKDPADDSLRDTFVDAGIANARTDTEREILLVQSRAPFVVHDQISGISALLDFLATARWYEDIDALTNRTRETPGALSFDLVWEGPADLDLFIKTPKSERLSAFPFSPSRDGLVANYATNNVLSGGRIEFDDRGPNEGGAPLNGGRETAFWPNTYPAGKYVVRVNYIQPAIGQTPMPATYTLTVRDAVTGEPRVIIGTINYGDKPAGIPVRVPKRGRH